MSILDRIKNAQIALELLFATMLIVPFQLLLLFFVFTALTNYGTLTVNSVLRLIPYFVGYFFLPIVLCIVFSHVLRPKRLVSPINVQIGTAVVFAMFLLYDWGSKPVSPTPDLQELQNLALLLIFLGFAQVVVGLYQFIFVRGLVGRNLIGIDRKSYSIDGNFETIENLIRHIITDRGFAEETVRDRELIYRYRATGKNVVIVLGPDPRCKNHSILASVAFHGGMYTVETEENISNFRDSVIREISAALLFNQVSYDIEELEDYGFDDPVSTAANTIALAPTISKIGKIPTVGASFRRIPIWWRFLIGITTLAIIAVNVVYWTGFTGLDFNEYVALTIFFVFTLPIEIGIPLREEIFRKRKETTS